MAVVSELIKKGTDGGLEFGDYSLDTKSKLSDFEFGGDLYKIKTFKEITKLERNELFVYESEPGTAVHGFKSDSDGVTFSVEGDSDAQITLELEPESSYEITIGDGETSSMKTNLGGKLTFSVELSGSDSVSVSVRKA
jgi:hypothetical protein